MAYFRKLDSQLAALHALLRREDNWMILINADPDALGGAMALSRLIRQKVHSVTIARINEITRPDNLAMIRYLRIPVVKWTPALSGGFQRFAIVDSQPSHNQAFDEVEFSVIIDHHPPPEKPHKAVFQEIKPEYGTTCAIMTEYLYNAEIRPGKRLATALQYGIRTDTNTFGRGSTEVDLRAYHFLTRFGDTHLLTRIMRSEYLPEWLPYFSRAFESLRPCGDGHFSSLGNVESPDLLVVVADFFMRVHGLRWVAVFGQSRNAAVVVFRGGGFGQDLGKLAAAAFGDVGSAGGHPTMARAEFSVEKVDGDMACFAYNRLKKCSLERRRMRRGGILHAPLAQYERPETPEAKPESKTEPRPESGETDAG